MRPLFTIPISRRVSLLVEPRDLWFGAFWDRRPGLVVYLGVPLLVLRVELSAACTGETASWCPVCGTCTCPREEDPRSSMHGARLEYSASCPLHGERSEHAQGLVEP